MAGLVPAIHVLFVAPARTWMPGTRPVMTTPGASFRALEPLHHLGNVLDVGRRGEALADQLAPFLEVGRLTEVDSVVLERLPLHEQPIALRLFSRARERYAVAAFGAPEDRRRRRDAGFESLLHAGLDVDLRDFGDHGGSKSEGAGIMRLRRRTAKLVRHLLLDRVGQARAYLPLAKKRSLWSSVAVSRIDLTVAIVASARLT